MDFPIKTIQFSNFSKPFFLFKNHKFWLFSLSAIHAFWLKIIKFVIFPKLFLVKNLHFLMVINHASLVDFIGFCL